MLYRSAIIEKVESVSKLPTSVQLMSQLIDKIYLFQKKCSFACVCAFFVVTSRTPTLPRAISPRNYVLISRKRSNDYYAKCSPYSRHSHIILKIRLCLLIESLPIHSFVSKLPTSVQLMPQLIDKIYLFQKKCSFACVCAFFVVTLHKIGIECICFIPPT